MSGSARASGGGTIRTVGSACVAVAIFLQVAFSLPLALALSQGEPASGVICANADKAGGDPVPPSPASGHACQSCAMCVVADMPFVPPHRVGGPALPSVRAAPTAMLAAIEISVGQEASPYSSRAPPI